tara:strand:+ start:336 stop:512 length:177 start_codon:yes stop_codon:yes gene_type:complete
MIIWYEKTLALSYKITIRIVGSIELVTAVFTGSTVSVPNDWGGVAQLVRAIACHAKSF